MNYPKQIIYPVFIHEAAQHIAKLRNVSNEQLMQDNPKFDRGNKNIKFNAMGLIAEMVFQCYLAQNEIEYLAADLVSNNPVSSWDLKINETGIDVKCISTGSKRFNINYDSHNKAKGIDTYIIIEILEPGSAQFWKFSHNQVSKWKVKQLTYSKAYTKPINEYEETNKAQPSESANNARR